jgi:hypothetical protein
MSTESIHRKPTGPPAPALALAPGPDASFRTTRWSRVGRAKMPSSDGRRALEALRQECEMEGRGEFFRQVKPWLTGDAAHGDQAALAEPCQMNPNSMKVAILTG